jgi:hypothetical protein
MEINYFLLRGFILRAQNNSFKRILSISIFNLHCPKNLPLFPALKQAFCQPSGSSGGRQPAASPDESVVGWLD